MSHLREGMDRAVHHVRETLSEDKLISEAVTSGGSIGFCGCAMPPWPSRLCCLSSR